MASQTGPSIVSNGLVFSTDPLNPKSWNGSTLKDPVGNRTITTGTHTTTSTTYGKTHFSSTSGESGSGTLDTGYRYGSIGNNDKIVGGDTSFTVMLWVYKASSSNPNNWWHMITDGHSGDIFTINTSGAFVISMNSSYGGTGASGTYSGINWSTAKNSAWNMFGVVYNISTTNIKAFVGHPDNGITFSSNIATSPINTAYKIRNFVGWGSSQSSYHADPSHSHCLAYNRALSDAEIVRNFNGVKTRFI